MDRREERKTVTASSNSANEEIAAKNKQKNRCRKRKRPSSSSESDNGLNLPENTLETERNVHASAIRNNLDDISVRKILKKVVANDHVLALVKLREEEEEDSGTEDKTVQPKLTRAKAKELKKVSSQSAPWNLENLELTPIHHIPVKTRPEVTALFAQELPDDEDDEEYEPTHEEAMSDDDQELSCSDIDSQPRTPATPKCTPSPKRASLQKDGPFKVPQDVSSARRKLVIDEEAATIALRTRSKLSLSTTTIEHIENEFVPPDDIPPQVDGLWNQFLNECFSASGTHEEDDDADPEYNAAADADAMEDDEEALGRSLIKISKKELNDLVTELFSIMPVAPDEDLTLDTLASTVLTDNTHTETPRWEGKVETLSDEEAPIRPSQRLAFEDRDNNTRFSIGKNEPVDDTEVTDTLAKENVKPTVKAEKRMENGRDATIRREKSKPVAPSKVHICIEERANDSMTQEPSLADAPRCLRSQLEPRATEYIHIQLDSVVFSEHQLMILQQQLRQHVQLAASNFLQLYVHPVHWATAPQYKEYLTAMVNLSHAQPNSVVKVCNLEPALELVEAWENSVSEDNPENMEMIEFINDQIERGRRRHHGNSVYVGDFHDKFKRVVANSSVFLYPYLIPAMPYRADVARRNHYLKSEDDLIVLGLDQFWQYIEANPTIFPRPRANSRTRWGLATALKLVSKHMVPWQTPKSLNDHVANVRSRRDKDSPIYNYFKFSVINPVKHTILPFNPALTLYEQPEHEMPRLWVRYLAKTSKRFKNYLNRKHHLTGDIPSGIPVEGVTAEATVKKPLPLDFTKHIPCGRPSKDVTESVEESAKITDSVFKLVETSTGAHLIPMDSVTVTSTDTATTPVDVLGLTIDGTALNIKTPEVYRITITKIPKRDSQNAYKHCTCCILLRKMFKKQTVITDFFKQNSRSKCYCSDLKYPKISNKLTLLLSSFKNNQGLVFEELERRIKDIRTGKETEQIQRSSLDELVSVTSFQLKVISRSIMSRSSYLKIRIRNMFTSFDATTHDPIRLANDLFKAFGVEMVDVYMDFLGFLTIEQVDKLRLFKQYFTRNCVKDLIDKVEEQVKNQEARTKILSKLKDVFSCSGSNSCDICSGLIETMSGYSQLAEYTFSLFPHREETRLSENPDTSSEKSVQTQEKASEPVAGTETDTMDCDGHVSSDEAEPDDASIEKESTVSKQTEEIPANIKIDPDTNMDIEDTPIAIDNQIDNEHSHIDNEHSQIDNEHSQIDNEHSHIDNEHSQIDIEDEQVDNNETDVDEDQKEIDVKPGCYIITLEEEIKAEPPDDWKREEDKLILEVLQEKLTAAEQRKNNCEMLEEKNVFKLIAGAMPQKSMDDVRKRVHYILSLLVQS